MAGTLSYKCIILFVFIVTVAVSSLSHTSRASFTLSESSSDTFGRGCYGGGCYPTTAEPPRDGGGGSRPAPEEPVVPPPAEPPPAKPSPGPSVHPEPTASEEDSGDHPTYGIITRNNVERCWNASLKEKDIESLAYLYNMIPCPEEVEKEKPPLITKRTWCNGIEIDLENMASIKVGFVNRNTVYNLDFGGDKENQFYCPWCFDSVRDYDEEGVDCGGSSCPPCVKIETATPVVDLECGDGRCQEGNEYTCPEDCRKPELALPVFLYLIVALVVNNILWKWGRRKMKLGKGLNTLFGITNVAIAGAMTWVVISYVCVSPLDCEQLMNVLVVSAISACLFVLVFRGMEVFEWVKLQLVLQFRNAEYATAYRQRMEVEAMIRKGEQILREDPYAAEVIYTALKPLYNSLPQEHKKKVIAKIRRHYKRIAERIRGHQIVQKGG